MKSLTQITRWLHTAVATLAMWSRDFVQELFRTLHIGDYWLVGIIFIALIGIQLSDFLLNSAVDRLRWVRRLFAGDDDIEGDWVSIVVDTSEVDKIIAAEYSRIRYRSGAFVFSGDAWSLDGKWKHNFCTIGSTHHNRQLEYHYKTGINRVGGFGVMIFLPDDSLAVTAICRYVDEGLKSPHATYSERLSTRLRKVSMKDRRVAALKFADGLSQENLLDFQEALGRSIL